MCLMYLSTESVLDLKRIDMGNLKTRNVLVKNGIVHMYWQPLNQDFVELEMFLVFVRISFSIYRH